MNSSKAIRILLIGLAIVAVSGVVVINMPRSERPVEVYPLPMVAPVQESAKPAAQPPAIPSSFREAIIGNPKAQVSIGIFESMSCSHCATFHNNVLPSIVRDYVDTGKAKVVMFDIAYDERAAAATMLLRCTDENSRYLELQDLFLNEQAKWMTGKFPDVLIGYATVGGISAEDAKKCLDNEWMFEEIKKYTQSVSSRFSITGTPTVVVYKGIKQKKIKGMSGYPTIKSAIDEVLEGDTP